MTAAEEPVRQLVEHLFRRQAGQLLASLSRAFGLDNFDLAEEVVQDALVQALRQWPHRGIPDDPAGWLARVARNRALDLLRRRANLRRKLDDLDEGRAPPDPALVPWDGEVEDDQLAMVFACCHPSLTFDLQVALTLKAVCGFGAGEVARAFLLPETTIVQRLVRARRRLREERVPFGVPAAHELPARLDAVLRVLYLLFNEGYSAHQGENLVRADLCDEAIRLAHLLTKRPDTALPRVHALLSLMLLQASRLPARTDAAGELLLLADQDRSLWDQEAIAFGLHHLEQASAGDELSAYHVEAGIAAVHAVAASYEATDWPRLAMLYERLYALAPSPVVALNRAVARAMVDGPEAGLALVEDIEASGALTGYYLLPATRAELLARLGRSEEADACYRAALASPCSEPERRFLQRRLDMCRPAGGPSSLR